ncbi:MAG: dTDP-4-dehydrorhamnose 3,5-epimerase [Actinomycetales bacterium]|nr:dTDP-4-dehydrorhamnose 3,5-epimerase [Actinomycetales bacterium]
MTLIELAIPGAWVHTPRQFRDERGVFLEWFQGAAFTEAVGAPLSVAQANCSVSAAGVVRGIHYADVPPGQAKYVTCTRGAVLDVVVDLREGSPTFGTWDSVLLDDVDRRAVYLSEGLGHAFCSLEDDSTVVYLCSTPYSPGREHGVHPLDPELGLRWPETARDGSRLELSLSDKDRTAPTLTQARDEGLLPRWADVQQLLADRPEPRPEA